MDTLFAVQSWAMLALGAVLLVVELFAFVEAARGSAIMYRAHGKLSKPLWLGITGVAVLLGVIGLTSPVTLPSIIAIVAAGVFLADVRPVVITRRGGRRDGPYGPW